MIFLFRNVLQAQILIICLYSTTITTVHIIQGKGKLFDSSNISKALEAFLRSFGNNIVEERRGFETIENNQVEKVINEKIYELKPFLEDNETVSKNLVEERNDDTLIVEVNPEDDKKHYFREQYKLHKEKLKKYNIVREKIYKKLLTENVTDKTRDLVIKTLDDLIKKMTSSECNWKRRLRSENPLIQPVDLSISWEKEWQIVRRSLTDSLINYKLNLLNERDVEFEKFLDSAIKLFNYISNDVEKIPKRYKISCKVINSTNTHTLYNSLKLNDETDTEKLNCKHFRVCSSELEEYLLIFYDRLNDTSVSVIKNYAELYSRDVARETDNENGSIVQATLNKFSKSTEVNVINIFIDETRKLKLDKHKNQEANIEALSKYTKGTVSRVKRFLQKKIMLSKLGLSAKLISTINDDIRVNSEMDLGNLERDLTNQICIIFQFCNGDYNSRRHYATNEVKDKIFVQMKFKVDDRFKNFSAYQVHTTHMQKLNDTLSFNVTRTTNMYNITQPGVVEGQH